ncbi:hypothetical protein MVEN_00341200 [Mycena venus]|uniref:Uncharacterized protein n=1 Tax=Mycena venus TaxID=2733690 RepID=A0A8H6YU56_9AGAR|nr:hypothetical protein MVEN_00341200 [Mycena venus]
MPPNNALADPLVASSYFSPEGGEAYKPLRDAMVAQAAAMGYEVATMTEHGIIWADDQDPFGHVGGATYARLTFKVNYRVFESFGKTLGARYDDLVRATGVGCIIRNYNTVLKRQVRYPDCLLTAVRISEVQPDRYYAITTMWSYQQQAIVAECSGDIGFFDYSKNKPANLLEYGGVYADLHRELCERSKNSNELYSQWVADHPKSGKRAKL